MSEIRCQQPLEISACRDSALEDGCCLRFVSTSPVEEPCLLVAQLTTHYDLVFTNRIRTSLLPSIRRAYGVGTSPQVIPHVRSLPAREELERLRVFRPCSPPRSTPWPVMKDARFAALECLARVHW